MPADSFAKDAKDKDDEPKVERPGLVKRTIRSFFNDDEDKGGRGPHWGPFSPAVDILSSGGGIAPMLHFWTPDIGGSPIDIHASAAYSIFRYQYYDLQVGLVPHDGQRLPRVETGTSALFPLSDIEKTSAAPPGFNIYASARYRDYPREDFYGLGPTSSRLSHSDYRLKDGLYEGIVRFRVKRLSVMGRAGVLRTSIGPGLDSAIPNIELSNNERTAPGLLRSPDFLHMSGGAWLELRDEPGNPHRGVSLGVAVSRFDDRHGNAFQFSRTAVDAREYLPLGSNRHVVALRQIASLDKPDAGSSVPFYMQHTLGRGTLLRGYSSSRFRDNKLLALAAEYRLELWPKIEFALIYETGKVFSATSDFDRHNLQRSYGAGIRLKSHRKVRFRIDVMRSVEGTQLHLKMGPAF